jgi:hypothetical protein
VKLAYHLRRWCASFRPSRDHLHCSASDVRVRDSAVFAEIEDRARVPIPDNDRR